MQKVFGALRNFGPCVVLLTFVLAPATAFCQFSAQNELGTNVQEPAIQGTGGQGVPAVQVGFRYRDQLANTVASAISLSGRRTMSTDVHTPWQIMHALLGLREKFRINDHGRVVSGLEWVSNGPKFEGEDWFLPSEFGGKAHPYSKPYAFEGHANQSLAILSMLGLPATHQLKAGDKTITIADMINHAKMEVSDDEEVSWSLWALSRYLPPDSQWQNKNGETWSIERMAKLQLDRLMKKPMPKHPCGGTHAMFALAHARNIRMQSGLQLRGTWLQVDQKIRKCIELARVQQNRNGQFTTKFFEGRATERDFDKRIASSGHILEFLMIALPPNELHANWVRRGIDATARDIMANSQSYVKSAPLFHAINGLSIYLDRTQTKRPQRLAAKPASVRKEQPKAQGDAKASSSESKPAAGSELLKIEPATRTRAVETTKPVATPARVPEEAAAKSDGWKPARSQDEVKNKDWKQGAEDDGFQLPVRVKEATGKSA